MSKIKVSFSPDFFSEKSKRDRVWEVNNNQDQICADISDIYQSATAVLKSEIEFDADDIAEIQRADTYDIVDGIPLVEKSICDLKLTLSIAGLKNQSEQELIVALMLQTKCGLQGKLLSQITSLLMEHGDIGWIGDKRVSVDYDKVRRETIFKAQTDMVSAGKIIGKSEFAVAVKNNKISLKNFTFEIDKNTDGAKRFIKNLRKDEGILNKIINLFSSFFTSTVTIKPSTAKVEPLKGKYLKPIGECSVEKMRPLYAVSESRIKSAEQNLPRRSESAEVVIETNYQPLFKSKSHDDASVEAYERERKIRYDEGMTILQQKMDALKSEDKKPTVTERKSVFPIFDRQSRFDEEYKKNDEEYKKQKKEVDEIIAENDRRMREQAGNWQQRQAESRKREDEYDEHRRQYLEVMRRQREVMNLVESHIASQQNKK